MDYKVIDKPNTNNRPSWAGNKNKFVDLLLSDAKFKFEDE